MTMLNPYTSSPKYNSRVVWYDSFAKGGKVVWLVFYGDQLLAEVKNMQQAQNVTNIANGGLQEFQKASGRIKGGNSEHGNNHQG